MSIYVLIPLLLLLVVLVVLNKRQKQEKIEPDGKKKIQASGKGKKAVSRERIATKKIDKSAGKNKEAELKAGAKKESAAVDVKRGSVASSEEDDWDWQAAPVAATSVAVEEVDRLTEYKVYKQFGYFQKAAESLGGYLKENTLKQGVRNALVLELAGLWLEAKDADSLCEVIDSYRDSLSHEEQENLIRQGLQLDGNNLPLRVLAEELLGWGVLEAEKEVGVSPEKNNEIAAEVISKTKTEMPASREESAQEHFSSQEHLDLVTGNVDSFRIRDEEKEALLNFADSERSWRLLKGQMPYDVAVRCLNKAIAHAEKPADLLIDALTADHQNRDVSEFAQHLWRLYYTLGVYGSRIKSSMLQWGSGLGLHPVFDALQSNPNETQLREIGMSFGYLPVNSSAMKARWLPLVGSAGNGDGQTSGTPAEKILSEAETLLNYGQLDYAMDALENAIVKYPMESQLYITLFGLYERSEDWDRLQNTLQVIREQIKTPPQEVTLAMSQLLQRMNRKVG
ncbi:hypothetical protein [Stenoxybacter acetivorans]|uniref:hypothetical protein n=1 Tax=Stenoxybacter acetivorans TaxID=422441 RepID=UPI0005620622|nr:hypothetical protein [Stenoxybacter acetivorans]